jgi:glucose-1-phosphate thymidylyltransferase
MAMAVKGVLVVATATSPSIAGDGPGTQPVANRPIVCHALDALMSAGIESVAVVAPAAAIADIQQCLDSGDERRGRITYLPQHERLDLLGALQAAAPFAGEDPTVVHFADGLLDQSLDELVDGLNGDMPDLLLLLHRGVDPRDGLGPATQKLLGIAELNGSPTRLALAGVCLFGPGGLRRASEVTQAPGAEVDLITIAEALASGGGVLEAAFVRSWRRYRGDPLDLLELNRLVLDQQHPAPDNGQRGDNRIEGRVIIHPTAEVTSSVILGPCIIGREARVSNSYIGPYTSIGARAEIDGAEIVRSIVCEGVRIQHVSGRIEGSTIGRRANIFRDFSLPRALRLHVGEGVEVALE